ncbi:MAG: hypothetical protein DHS20C17_31260 [Cyclobacteriaceae bacterium]|nr:MAG: hypothetical protein DHS20C17_31260 [Cyclobacteriaceae bacterium]
MNKTKFLELVKNPDSIEEKDLTKLDELISEHPYSQIVHILNVKGRKVFNRPDFEESLNLAATYSYDRGLLQSIVEGINFKADTEIITKDIDPVPEVDEVVSEETSDFSWISEDDYDDNIFIDDDHTIDASPGIESEETPQEHTPDVEKEGESIRKTEKIQNEASDQPVASESQPEEVQPVITAKTESGSEADSSSAPKSEPADKVGSDQEKAASDQKVEPQAQPAPKSDTETVDTSEAVIKTEKSETKESDEGKKPSKKKHKGKTTKITDDPLETEIAASGIHAELMKNLSQLQESKQHFENHPDKNGGPNSRTEQIEIIDNFIKNSPVLSMPNLNAESEGVVSQDDLSKTSTRFNEEIVSENLARIYLKQGKRKDAEKIYKKLMVKFPQKKAYFADRIQKLKKK